MMGLKHIAIIMDGNRRWAEARDLLLFEGHREGEKRVEPLIDRAIELGISNLTFWAFSTENWRREKEEVEFLLDLFRDALRKKVDRFHKRNVRLNIIGDMSRFPQDLQQQTREWVEKTKENKKITVNMALNYGGRNEITRAVNKILKLPITNPPAGEAGYQLPVTEQFIARYLDTAGQPDPDLIIRTGGRRRLSGFLAWQAVYAELYFTDTLWPDFTVKEFDKAVEWFKQQQRNFGT